MRDSTGHWRIIAGIAALIAAAVVGLVGYLKLSLEPSLNHQIPYLASAGMALVVLCTIGGCLIVSDVIRSDSLRTEELAPGRERRRASPSSRAAPSARSVRRAGSASSAGSDPSGRDPTAGRPPPWPSVIVDLVDRVRPPAQPPGPRGEHDEACRSLAATNVPPGSHRRRPLRRR
jgi:hypothetical protein